MMMAAGASITMAIWENAGRGKEQHQSNWINLRNPEILDKRKPANTKIINAVEICRKEISAGQE